VVIAGIAFAVLSAGGGKSPPPAPNPPEPQAALPAPAAAAPSPAATAAAPAPEGSAEPTAGATPAAEPSPGPAPAQPSGKAANGGFADLFAEGAKHAATDAPTGRFDPAAARNALEDQLQDAARCRETGGPLGITEVSVTFSGNGAVSSALITEPPFANTSVGTCITNAMKRARIKPFSGAATSVSQRISIR